MVANAEGIVAERAIAEARGVGGEEEGGTHGKQAEAEEHKEDAET